MTLPSMPGKQPHYLEDGHDEPGLFAHWMPIWEALMRIRSSDDCHKDKRFDSDGKPAFQSKRLGGVS